MYDKIKYGVGPILTGRQAHLHCSICSHATLCLYTIPSHSPNLCPPLSLPPLHTFSYSPNKPSPSHFQEEFPFSSVLFVVFWFRINTLENNTIVFFVTVISASVVNRDRLRQTI
ncbi:hypothetical protein VNO78_17201 [Psophocarpus tetragonolobus]|uniref:Uncharacterized protein n=1 Tax=Psophocarpus tetragonolobus TaxID=3891 RepID=A0AAN9SJ79_PSOTE